MRKSLVSLVALACLLPVRMGLAAEAGGESALRAAARCAHRRVGAAVDAAALASDPNYRRTLSREFTMVTAEGAMKWGAIHPFPNWYGWGPVDKLVEFAQRYGMKVHGHTLLWHRALPDYVNESVPPEELRAMVRDHILTVVGRYRGQIRSWDVVNEAVSNSDTTHPLGLHESVFTRVLGDDYIADAFRWAHEADPAARLYYNDYSLGWDTRKADRVVKLVKHLKAQGVPIHGIGFQAHLVGWRNPRADRFAASMQRFTQMGLRVRISEMDVQMRDFPGSIADKLDAQAKVYRDFVGACARLRRCDDVLFWGFTDAHSWLPEWTGHPEEQPLPFDRNYQPKPAYQGAVDGFNAAGNPNATE